MYYLKAIKCVTLVLLCSLFFIPCTVQADLLNKAESTAQKLLNKFQNKTQQGQDYLKKTEKSRRENYDKAKTELGRIYDESKKYVDENKDGWRSEIEESAETAKNKTQEYINENKESWRESLERVKKKLIEWIKKI